MVSSSPSEVAWFFAAAGTARNVSIDPQPELIQRAQSGDVRAFQLLMREHRQRVVSLIHRILGPSGDVPAATRKNGDTP